MYGVTGTSYFYMGNPDHFWTACLAGSAFNPLLFIAELENMRY